MDSQRQLATDLGKQLEAGGDRPCLVCPLEPQAPFSEAKQKPPTAHAFLLLPGLWRPQGRSSAGSPSCDFQSLISMAEYMKIKLFTAMSLGVFLI